MNAASTPPLVIGRYRLYGILAEGGMAAVHFGRLRGPGGFSRTVALKRMHPHFARDRDLATTLLDEARIASRIQHANVVQTIDVIAEPELVLVMEYVAGESLARLARASSLEGHAIPHDVGAAIVCGVLHGLHAAHEATDESGAPLGIVHRDVSPQNVLVGSDGVARVLDFGIAKAIGRLRTTRDGQLKGKLSYMSPEQLCARSVDRRTDVYAAAVMLWEVLTGNRLFVGDNDGQIMHRVLDAAVEPPTALAPDVPPAVDAITMRGLSRDPAARFATAREMALALEAVIRPATPARIATWVESLASGVLSERAKIVRDIESEREIECEIEDVQTQGDRVPSAAPVPSVAAPTPSAPSRPRRAALVVTALVVATALGAVVATLAPIAVRSKRAPASLPAAAPASASALVPAPPTAPSSDTQAVANDTPVVSRTPARGPIRGERTRRRAPAVTPSAEPPCLPAYADDAGIIHPQNCN